MNALFQLPSNPALNMLGLPAGASTLTFYLTGTTTLANIYDEDGDALTNPVVASAVGRFVSIYLDPAITYRVVLKDVFGATLDDVDPYTSGSVDSSRVDFTPSGTGAIERTVQDKLRDYHTNADYTRNPAPLAVPPSQYVIGGDYAFGATAMDANTRGFNNIAVGDDALGSSLYSRNNIAIGNDALKTVVGDVTGARGEESPGVPGTYFANGDNNIAVGQFALRDLTTGFENLAIGSYCLRDLTTGKWNVAVGTLSQTLGTATISCVSIGNYNLVISTGNYNFAGGHATLEGNTTGAGNVAVGHISMNQNTTGSFGTAYGAFSLRRQTTGTYNTAIGYEAMQNVTTGANNVAVGANALNALAGAGTNNTGVGTNSLLALASGDGNTALGSGAGNTINGLTNTTQIGLGANCTASNQVKLGNNSVTEVTTAGFIQANSDDAVPAGGSQSIGLKVTSTAHLGVYFGSGAPTLSAAQGSLYMRTDGSSTSTRMYVNTNGTTGWTNVVTAT